MKAMHTVRSLFVFAGLVFGANTMAAPVDVSMLDTIDFSLVGPIDTLVGTGSFNPSDPATETAWAEDFLSLTPGSLDFLGKDEDLGEDGAAWLHVTNAGQDDIFALLIDPDTDYAVLKSGAPTFPGEPDHFLYENIESGGLGLDYLVLDFSILGWDVADGSFDQPSHATYLGSIDVSPVPVPGAVWLFGSALIGFIGFARRTRMS